MKTEHNTKSKTLQLPTLAMIVPAYNEEEVLPLFFEEAQKVMKKLEARVACKVLIVDDGSSDKTLGVAKILHKKDSRFNFISFSRNFGKEAAILAGLQHADSDYTAIMDADLQDPPSLLPQMLDMIETQGCDCVGTRRSTRKGEPVVRSWFSRRFYKFMNNISDAEVVDGARDFQLMTRKVVDAIISMGEYNRFSKGIYGWVGFKREWIAYENIERAAGKTKWSFWSLFHYALEGIMAFSTKPLQWVSKAGLVISILAVLALLFVFIRAAVVGDRVAGWPSLACLVLFLSGIQILFLGIIGQYLAKTYLEVKNRPIYIVREASIERKRKQS